MELSWPYLFTNTLREQVFKILETFIICKYHEFMNPLAEQIGKTNLAGRIFNDRQLACLLGGADARRYGLVNRALKEGALIRVKRGLYIMKPNDHSEPVHPFAVAQAIMPGSYISFETALAYHGWTPEAVYTTSSVSPERKTIAHDHEALGQFTFHPLAINDYQFLTSINREKIGKLTAFVAQPLRALMDLVALRKVPWSGIDWVTRGMRVDETELFGLRRRDFLALRPVYKHKAVNTFLDELESVVFSMKVSPTKRALND